MTAARPTQTQAVGATVSVRRDAHTSVGVVLSRSLAKFDPRKQVRNPVIFVVYAFTFFTAAVWAFPWLFPDIVGTSSFSRSFYLAVTAILLLTVWFANIAEAVAEAQAKAQADSLREVRAGLRARQILPDGKQRWIAATQLHRGDLVEVRPGETVPLDGDVAKGGAMIDESMMTGESAAVVRESGGDRTSVLGGSRILDGTIELRITSEPGTSFLDRMIQLVEATSA
ncbi:MAG: potassium-transporting ATPase subunit B, partial [Thermoplasmata archaeon]|nr:potassium-transporting ATPase subunit B [Thermoplasmata archaeon]